MRYKKSYFLIIILCNSIILVYANADKGTYPFLFFGSSDISETRLPPEITNVSADPPLGNESANFSISADVTANAGVDTVLAMISDPEGRETQMVLENVSSIYNGTNDLEAGALMLPGNYSFYIWANDSNGLSATSLTYGFRVIDTIAPVISSVGFAPLSANESAFITISANVTDNRAVDAVNATVSKPGGASAAIVLNDPDKDGVYSDIFSDTGTPGDYSVIVAASDTSGNNASTAENFATLDTKPPMLQSLEVSPRIDNTNSIFLIKANVTDNKEIDAVKVNVIRPNGYSESLDMSNDNGYYEYNYTNTSAVGRYMVRVWANDTSGNELNSYLDLFAVQYAPSVQEVMNFTLNSGWNLISIPLEQDNWSITSVLASIEGKYTVVFAYTDGGWKRSTAPRSPLTEMSLGYGYWIYMTAPDTLELSGTVPSATTINISPGLNLVGYPSLTTRNITTVLPSVNYSVVYTYIDGGWKRSTAPRSPLTNMSPGYGYWINATGASSYEVTD